MSRSPLAAHSVRTVHRSEHASNFQQNRMSPRVDRDFHPVRHWRGAPPPVLANEIHDAPTTVTLQHVVEG